MIPRLTVLPTHTLEGWGASLLGAAALAAWGLVFWCTVDTLRLNPEQLQRYGEGSAVITALLGAGALVASIVAWWLHRRWRQRQKGIPINAYASLAIFAVGFGFLSLLIGLIVVLSAAFFGVMS